MNPDIDDLIRDAVRRQEALAADPDRIRAALPARTARQQRTRRLATVGVAVAVAVAVAVPVIALRESTPGGGGPAASSTAPTTEPAMPGLATGPLRYRPTWLPEGMVERFRTVPLNVPPGQKDTTDRLWKPLAAGDGPTGHLGLASWDFVPSAGDTAAPPVALGGEGGRGDVATNQKVDINGKPGTYDTEMVTWQVDADTKLMLYAPETGLSKEDMLRVARSVEPDPTELRAPMRVDWLPEGVGGELLSVWGDSPNKWGSWIFADGDRAYVNVTIDTTPAEARGEQVNVDGRVAHVAQVDEEETIRANYRTKWVLTMDLGDGRFLTVRGGTVPNSSTNSITRDDMVRIAQNVVFDPSPDLTWLGR